MMWAIPNRVCRPVRQIKAQSALATGKLISRGLVIVTVPFCFSRETRRMPIKQAIAVSQFSLGLVFVLDLDFWILPTYYICVAPNPAGPATKFEFFFFLSVMRLADS